MPRRVRCAVGVTLGLLAVAPWAGAAPVADATLGTGAAAGGDDRTTRTQAIGGVVGLAAGGGSGAGGLVLGGVYLYRLTDRDWLESGMGFTFGAGGADCYRDRDDALVCDHGVLDGYAGEVTAAVRRELAGQDGFEPFVRAGVGLRVVSYPDDDLRGLAVPALLGGGVRAEVADDVHVVAGADLRLGLASMGRGVGLEPVLGLAVAGGVELALD